MTPFSGVNRKCIIASDIKATKFAAGLLKYAYLARFIHLFIHLIEQRERGKCVQREQDRTYEVNPRNLYPSLPFSTPIERGA